MLQYYVKYIIYHMSYVFWIVAVCTALWDLMNVKMVFSAEEQSVTCGPCAQDIIDWLQILNLDKRGFWSILVRLPRVPLNDDMLAKLL